MSPGRRPTLASRTALVTVAVVVVALLVAGLVSLGLIRTAAKSEARRLLADQADTIAALLDTAGAGAPERALTVLRGQDTSAALVDGNGTMRGDLLARGAARKAGSALAGGSPLSYEATVGGTSLLVETRPVAGGQTLVLARTSERAAGLARTLLRRQALALGLGLLVAAVAAVLLARWVAAPLTRAAAGARRLTAGERDVTVTPEGPAEVAQVADSVNALATALNRSEARQREFLLSVSHELRTPLTAVKGFAEALADGVTTGADVPAAGRTILAESARLERLVGDLLDLARLGTQDFRVDLVDVDLTAALGDAAAVWSARCATAGVVFRAELPDHSVPVRTDPARMRQIVDGLAENALRVTPEGRPIVLALRVADAAVVEVRDGGPGLTAEDRAVAFDRSALYERYRGVRTVGTGLGLALVHGLAERLGASVEVDEAPEGGACFRVRFPFAGTPASGRSAR